MKAFLILEDGTVFEGTQVGADREIISEIVFNTSMAGYLEVLTDPSYAGQAVCMTYPLIGNYGICKDDMESKKPWPDGFIVRELSRNFSNFRADFSIQQFLQENNVPGIAGIDTRALTKILREKGTMNGMITTDENYRLDDVIPRLKAYTTGKVVEKVTCKEKYELKGSRDLAENGAISGSAKFISADYEAGKREKKPSLVKELNGAGRRVALLDLGTKDNIAYSLKIRGCDVTVYPATTLASEIIASNPDGIMLSNGPGDPKECQNIIAEIKKLYGTDIPIFAICLGHQLMALATGADTYKMKYGHRGGNHPVKDLATGRVYISSQNHGYVVDMEKLDPKVATPAFINVNDGTNEGLNYTGKNIFTVQFHPEACCGPQDSGYLFDRFIEMMNGGKMEVTR
ncbi:MAG: carbamoyl phosphate synthase small subunit [Lachnospiraceae bacterium]|nr:carbamoyl phosphate synthase small subunit [Lachnospiraceae bacterium]MDE7203392.1 carbamoyl phosphate synthase small subunit [Lachnospiraceae bacterium]